MMFPAGSVYSGKIIKQNFFIAKNNDVPCLTLVIKVDGQLINPRRPGAGKVNCDSFEADVLLRFPADNDQTLGIAQENLQRLGFDSDDLELLNPASPGHVSFVGKSAYVSPKESTYNEQTSIFWNLRFPADYVGKTVDPGAMNSSPAAKAYKDLIKKKKEEAAAQAAGIVTNAATSESDIPF